MNILILSYGTRGDVQPYVALGLGLQARGHDVTLATAGRFESFVSGHGLGFAPLSDAMLAILDTDEGREMVENTQTAAQTLRRTITMLPKVGPMQRELVGDCWRAMQQVEPDLILFHPKAYVAPAMAEKIGVPVVLALLMPMVVPTASEPMMGFPDLRSPGWNRTSYRLVNRLMGFSAGRYVRAARKAHGLPARRRFDITRTADGTPIPILHAVSPSVLPRPTDWPETARMCGYWFLDEEGYKPPAALAAFLDGGPPPVYIGFGSMAGRSPARLGRAVVDALERVGLRGVIATGWGGLAPGDLPQSILQIESAPHAWLFPRMAAVVHHGGAGTTAAAARAGRPQVVVPFFGDQPWWGAKMQALGVAPQPLPQKALTAQALAEALRTATTDPAIAAAARALAARVGAEDGVGQAVADIEALTGLTLDNTAA